MKTRRSKSLDADLTGAGRALERAATRARRLAEDTATPLYVFKGGRVVDLNAPATGAYAFREGTPRK